MGSNGQVVAERAGMSGARAAAGPAEGAMTDVGVVPATGAAGLLKRTVTSGITTTADGSSVAGAGIAAPGTGNVSDAFGRAEAAHPPAVPDGCGLRDGFGLSGAGGGVVEDVVVALEDGAAALEAARAVALPAGRVFDVQEAADFAARVEDLSRSIGYLQIIAAHAVERTRTEAKNTPTRTAPGWQTGWTENRPRQPRTNTDPAAAAAPSGTDTNPAAVLAGAGSVLDDGYRNAAEFLRARLRIDIREARRRLTQATLLLPGTTLTAEPTTPRHQHLAAAFAATEVPSPSATIITKALERVALIAHPRTLTTMEHALTRTAAEADPDFLAKTAQHWINRIDHDGPEPTEEELRTIQGAFIRKPRRGLHHIEIFATDEQYETLITTMNTATNPRLTPTKPATSSTPNTTTTATHSVSTTNPATSSTPNTADIELDRRSRAQKLLDGLTMGCNYALHTGKLPANGGLKPQVTVTIDANNLYTKLQNPNHHPHQAGTTTATSPPSHPGQSGLPDNPGNPDNPGQLGQSGLPGQPGSATATFTGPIHATTIRKIACDAEILPVLLGTDGQILDIGRATRIFPPHIRKAITARDQGCTFPDCTIPAPWCEAHHITYWSQGGTTSTNNGTLLCSHHHHLIHKEQWKITTTQGTPWFTPPPHIDPTQTPRKNHHHTPQRTSHPPRT